ncbi:MAG: hypothetical protein UU18_C0011G0016 [Parcubacteria group bacterium GW2011_GWB2_40_8]|nr:MAG: hypothetical protein UT71_C0002G0033 [Parcubacteria group bacterium GW2011_GWF2_40_10]KKR47810.1 MAG: hypothetical protein UT83_C0003G0023 [Parcubacteria group bacterium GW2011_GWA2_40_143]KKR60241.1 MAG: hypothetical protein UT97_C0003G0023 [Parcubacteria group bacterium GW2011_GWC2_40_31]KKR75211.1 MAG: hypothetical protein UU18_C0011G0016 [Parcubacteria group bacterium GW2011_GWB2_40_8]KKR80758.1 MAG: hypothetical protein UU28_C0033G0004 [Parcubacteria group bacterium GW2011_GWD2_40_
MKWRLMIVFLCCLSAKSAGGTKLDFNEAVKERSSFEIMYGAEAKLFLAKNRIPVSLDFEKYVRQNRLEIFSCYSLMENGKIVMITIKYIVSELCSDESDLCSSDENFKMPREPYVVAEYKIDFHLAITWWRIKDLYGAVRTGKEVHFVY